MNYRWEQRTGEESKIGGFHGRQSSESEDMRNKQMPGAMEIQDVHRRGKREKSGHCPLCRALLSLPQLLGV